MYTRIFCIVMLIASLLLCCSCQGSDGTSAEESRYDSSQTEVSTDSSSSASAKTTSQTISTPTTQATTKGPNVTVPLPSTVITTASTTKTTATTSATTTTFPPAPATFHLPVDWDAVQSVKISQGVWPCGYIYLTKEDPLFAELKMLLASFEGSYGYNSKGYYGGTNVIGLYNREGERIDLIAVADMSYPAKSAFFSSNHQKTGGYQDRYYFSDPNTFERWSAFFDNLELTPLYTTQASNTTTEIGTPTETTTGQ